MQCWTRFPVNQCRQVHRLSEGTRCSGLYYFPVQKGYRIIVAQFCVLVWCLPKRTVFIWYPKGGNKCSSYWISVKKMDLNGFTQKILRCFWRLTEAPEGVGAPDVTQLFVSEKRMRESCIIRVVYFFFVCFHISR